MSVVTRSDIADYVYANLRVTHAESLLLVALVFERITQALQNGDEVRVRGFGTFTARSYPGRPGRNPRTGEDAPVPPRTVALFRAGDTLRRRVNGQPDDPPPTGRVRGAEARPSA